MRKIDKPVEVAEDVYITCVGMVKNPALRGRLKAGKDLIKAASLEFDDKVTTGTMHTIIRENLVNNNLTKKELELVYTLRMARKGATGRTLYDKLLLAAKLGICPLCNQREATTIDHYLPKTEYPRLSVVPINLIPCCKDCNNIKNSFYPVTANQEIIHPYYDDIEDVIWLTADIVHSNPCSVKYSVHPPVVWTDLLANRVCFHFNKLEIGKLYAIQAAVELSQIRSQLNNLLKISGVAAVKKYLMDSEDSRSRANVNSWQATFYRAAAIDNWFCNGGFK